MAGFALALVTLLAAVQGAGLGCKPGARHGSAKDAGDCRFQFNPVGTAKFTTSWDIEASFLTRNSAPYDVVQTAAPGAAATVKIGDTTIVSYDAVADQMLDAFIAATAKSRSTPALIAATRKRKRRWRGRSRTPGSQGNPTKTRQARDACRAFVCP